MTRPSPPSTYDFLATASEAHAKAGYDFPQVLDAYFTSGYVFKGPDYFMLVHADDANDAWILWWAEKFPKGSSAEMARLFLRNAPHYRSRIGWARGLRNKGLKFVSTDRLVRFSSIQ